MRRVDEFDFTSWIVIHRQPPTPHSFMPQTRYLGKWLLLETLGRGGNGAVWKARLNGQEAAIKVLQRHDQVGRFQNEVEGMRRLGDIEGVLPILDANIPSISTKSQPAWFVMALAIPLQQALGERPGLNSVVLAISEIATVLSKIHARGFSHRDIKPENLFHYAGRWAVGDFGLVAFDGMTRQTVEGKKLGPLHYIAPEMLNDAFDADGQPADVFSLAKTLWVLATGQTYPLPGPYSVASPMCQLHSYVASYRTASLDLLIERCSKMEADARPTMNDFASELKAWLQDPTQAVVGPLKLTLGAEWMEISNAADHEKSRGRLHNEIRELKTSAIWALEERFIEFCKELRETLSAAHFINIEGPNRLTSPTGIQAWLPIVTHESKRVGLEVRAWFSPDWSNDDNYVISALLIARLTVRTDAIQTNEPIYERRSSFLMGGPGEETTIQMFFREITNSLREWADAARKRRESLG